jgi:hypothetical protein
MNPMMKLMGESTVSIQSIWTLALNSLSTITLAAPFFLPSTASPLCHISFWVDRHLGSR